MPNGDVRSTCALTSVLMATLVGLSACNTPTTPDSDSLSTARDLEANALTVHALSADSLPRSTWIIKDLGVMPGDNHSAATAVSDHEGIVGYSENGNGPDHGFLFHWHGLQPIPPLAGAMDAMPTGVNDADHVVGNSGGQPFFWTDSTGTQPLPVMPGGWSVSVAGINDYDDATGCAYPPDTASLPLPHLVEWLGPSHTLKDLGNGAGAINGGQCGLAINHSGQIAVQVGVSGLNPTFGRFSPGRPIRTMASPPGGEAYVAAINWAGSLAGQGLNVSGIGPYTFALVWREASGFTIVPFFPVDSFSQANGIDNQNVVVGASHQNGSSCMHPWVWTFGDSSTALLPSLTGFHSGGACNDNTSPAALNDGHEIVGMSPNASGQDHAVRWVKEPWQ